MNRLAAVALLLVLPSCEKTKTAASPGSAPSSVALADGAGVRDGALEGSGDEAVVTELWARAKDGDADERARLAREVGSDALVSALDDPSRRLTALAALAFADDFTPLPALARRAATGNDAEAARALESVAALVTRIVPATDRDDALELRGGETELEALARDETRPPSRRARAVTCLRLLADRGWLPPAEIPADIDGH